MIHGFIYNPQHSGTLGEYFLLNLFPNSLELFPTSPRNARRFKTGLQRGKVHLLGVGLGALGEGGLSGLPAAFVRGCVVCFPP